MKNKFNEMKEKIREFELVLNRLEVLYSINSTKDFEEKITGSSWSKKEIMGHLIDSAINNLQRFTEIQYFEKPYVIRQYNPDELVKSNKYQDKNGQELYELWIQLNKHIIYLAKNLDDTTLKFQLILPNKEQVDLQFLIEDYFDHFYHHLNQINSKWI